MPYIFSIYLYIEYYSNKIQNHNINVTDVVLVLLNLHLQCKHGSGCRVEVSSELYLLRVR